MKSEAKEPTIKALKLPENRKQSIASYDIGTKKINRTKSYEKQMNCIIRIDDYTFMSKCQDSVVIWKKINNNQRNNICLSTLE